ncbi:putative GTP-binding protein YPTC5 [Blattamonas nauphoetae]|uniref:Ras-related protein Rab n=1 Tax=Blattamonas nauphoetae TaxID=2049346 RepID=A0ABQ9XFT5_9EUKA|nr:putative GTP-binding protein YPTC5 [Blattamonas nauphoetae]
MSAQKIVFKVLVVGDFAVGKTSIIKRYVQNVFNPLYKLTIGVDFLEKTVDWDQQTRVTLQLWDVAANERFGHMTSVYYKNAIAAIIVADLERPATLETALKWKEDINEVVSLADGTPIPFLLLANKVDSEDASLDREYLNQFTKEKGFIQWFDTSAKQNVNIDKAMTLLIQTILDLGDKIQRERTLEDPEPVKAKKGKKAPASKAKERKVQRDAGFDPFETQIRPRNAPEQVHVQPQSEIVHLDTRSTIVVEDTTTSSKAASGGCKC